MHENPYSFSGPVFKPHMFYGYRSELEYIVSRVRASARHSFLVIGGGMMGKTTLLLQVQLQLRNKNVEPIDDKHSRWVIPLYFDMSDFNKDCSVAHFLEKIARRFLRSLRMYPPPFPISEETKNLLASVPGCGEPEEKFTDALYQLAEDALHADFHNQLRVVFLIDNLWRKPQEINEYLIVCLRSLYMEPLLGELLAYVVTSSNYGAEWISAIDPRFHSIFDIGMLHVFDEGQSLALINEPVKTIKIPKGIAEEVYLESGGHPFLLQYLLSVLCECDDSTELTIGHIEEAIKRFERGVRTDFERWWEKFSEADKRVYRTLLDPRHDHLSVNQLNSIRLSFSTENGGTVIMHAPMIRDSLRTLRTMGLIWEYEGEHGLIVYKPAGRWPTRWFRDIFFPPKEQ